MRSRTAFKFEPIPKDHPDGKTTTPMIKLDDLILKLKGKIDLSRPTTSLGRNLGLRGSSNKSQKRNEIGAKGRVMEYMDENVEP